MNYKSCHVAILSDALCFISESKNDSHEFVVKTDDFTKKHESFEKLCDVLPHANFTSLRVIHESIFPTAIRDAAASLAEQVVFIRNTGKTVCSKRNFFM